MQNCQVAAEWRLASPWGSELHTSVLHEGPGVDPGAAESSLGTGTVLLPQQTCRHTGTRVCARVLWLPPGSVAPQVCLKSLYVLPLKVFIQVYVPENLWISSSAACGSMLGGEKGRQLVGWATVAVSYQVVDNGFRASAAHTPAPLPKTAPEL